MNKHERVMILFGSTGDLSFNKLLPSLASLLKQHPDKLNTIVLVGRQVSTLEDYLQLAAERGLSYDDIAFLKPYLHYVYMQANNRDDYLKLSEIVAPFSMRWYYIATPPTMYALILENLSFHGLFQKHQTDHHIAFEKPFGENEEGATVLSQLVHQFSTEKQIYRVDHYLAKPLIADLLTLRHQHPSLTSLFQTPYLKHVRVNAFETLGILSRGKFYDQTGAIHDMIQSHLLETLALSVMALPQTFSPQAIQQAKISFFDHLELIPQSVILGQYEGYREEVHIPKDSLTETFASLTLRSKENHFLGTHFTIQTGKRLSAKRTEIVYEFFDGTSLVLNISPLVKIKAIGPDWTTSLSFAHNDIQTLTHMKWEPKEAYIKIFEDFIEGNQTLFPSGQEIEATWKLVSSIKRLNLLPRPYHHEKDLLGGN